MNEWMTYDLSTDETLAASTPRTRTPTSRQSASSHPTMARDRSIISSAVITNEPNNAKKSFTRPRGTAIFVRTIPGCREENVQLF
jgi:hypothetical protein